MQNKFSDIFLSGWWKSTISCHCTLRVLNPWQWRANMLVHICSVSDSGQRYVRIQGLVCWVQVKSGWLRRKWGISCSSPMQILLKISKSCVVADIFPQKHLSVQCWAEGRSMVCVSRAVSDTISTTLCLLWAGRGTEYIWLQEPYQYWTPYFPKVLILIISLIQSCFSFIWSHFRGALTDVRQSLHYVTSPAGNSAAFGSSDMCMQ